MHSGNIFDENATKLYVWVKLGPIRIDGQVWVAHFDEIPDHKKPEAILRGALNYLGDLGLEWDWSFEPPKPNNP